MRAMSVTARDADLPSRYQDQLCIDISILTSSLSQIKYRDRGLFADISKNGIFGKEAANEKVYS